MLLLDGDWFPVWLARCSTVDRFCEFDGFPIARFGLFVVILAFMFVFVFLSPRLSTGSEKEGERSELKQYKSKKVTIFVSRKNSRAHHRQKQTKQQTN